MLHDNNLNVRGTSTAIYDYAINLKNNHNIECFISYDKNDRINDNRIINKFKKEFDVYGYDKFDEVDNFISQNKIDGIYLLKSGSPDGKISRNVPNFIHAVFPISNEKDIHGQKYAFVSEWLSEEYFNRNKANIPFVPHMLNLPDVEGNYREILKIDKDSLVIGRYGGLDSFDIPFVIGSIRNALNLRNDIVFVFCNTVKFIDHPRVLFTNSLASLNEKVKFLNTCDGFLHARQRGESFGLSILEAMSKNLPIMTYSNSSEKNHYKLLDGKGLLYGDQDELYNHLVDFKKTKIQYDNIKDFMSDVVTDKFINTFLK